MIYICIPTHNEQQTVGVVLWKLRQVLTDYPRDYQLLVADDASTDKTRDVLEPYTRVLPLTVVHTERQQGHAACLEMLLREATRRSEYPKRDVIVTLQADFSEDPDDLVALLKRMEAGADVAVGIKVAKAKEPAMRRFARRLSGFFARRQEWPEGVVTPFDGYRAYRLHAVKRAMEEREGERVLRFDGWAGHAELLRAVLPHARRVDVVEVEDRGDRRTRPSREKPMAAAMQVRAMMRDAAPAGLVPVEELDRMVATARRAREEANRAENGDGRRAQQAGNGGRNGRDRSRSRDGRARDGRSRGEPQSRSGRGRDSQGGGQGSGGGSARRERTQSGGGADRPRRQRPPRPADTETPADEQEQQPPAAAGVHPTGAVADASGAQANGEAQDGGEGQPRKRRRRRRRRSGSGRSGSDSQQSADATADGSASPGEGSADEAGPAADGEQGGEPAADGEKKRRRRGGRRGGRRRRKRPDGEATGEATGEAAAEGGGSPSGEADSGPAGAPRRESRGESRDAPAREPRSPGGEAGSGRPAGDSGVGPAGESGGGSSRDRSPTENTQA